MLHYGLAVVTHSKAGSNPAQRHSCVNFIYMKFIYMYDKKKHGKNMVVYGGHNQQ